MILSIKRKTILLISLFIVCVVTFCVVVSAASKSAYSGPSLGKTIVIDAGHGGIDGGVVGTSTGTKESDINLAISKSLRHFLESKGYNVVMTRTTTDGLYGMATKNRKMRDLEARKEIINNARPDLVVSIHQNSYPRENVKGAQVFYAPKSEVGLQYSSIMQNILNITLNPNNAKVAKEGDYYMLQCSEYPSMLIECGFLSNKEEEKLLLSASYQEKVAYTIFSGINSILMTGDSENTSTG